MSEFESLSQKEYGTELIGPFFVRDNPYVLSVDGFRIDNIELFQTQDGSWEVVLDNRIVFPGFTKDEINKFGSLLAHSIVMGHNAKYGKWSIALESLFGRITGIRTSPNDFRKTFEVLDGGKE